jgi:hypothetical protein
MFCTCIKSVPGSELVRAAFWGGSYYFKHLFDGDRGRVEVLERQVPQFTQLWHCDLDVRYTVCLGLRLHQGLHLTLEFDTTRLLLHDQ